MKKLIVIVAAMCGAMNCTTAKPGSMGFIDGTPYLGITDSTLVGDTLTMWASDATVRINLIGAYQGCEAYYPEFGPVTQCWTDFTGVVSYADGRTRTFTDVHAGATGRMDAQLQASGAINLWFAENGRYLGDVYTKVQPYLPPPLPPEHPTPAPLVLGLLAFGFLALGRYR
jgi:hypothetical protein